MDAVKTVFPMEPFMIMQKKFFFSSVNIKNQMIKIRSQNLRPASALNMFS